MDKKEVEREKAAERIRRLLNGDFDGMEPEITFSYAKKATEGSGKEELEKCLKSIKESYLKQVRNTGAVY